MSNYQPYASFEEWSLAHQKQIHGQRFLDRAATVLQYLIMLSREHPGRKVKNARLTELYNAKYPDDALTVATMHATLRYLRNEGEAINSDADGFWYSLAPEDICNTLKHLQDREYAIRRAKEILSGSLPRGYKRS